MDSLLIRLIRFLTRRPLLVNLLLVFIIMLSIISILKIQRVGLPRVDMYELRVSTVYPGASPEDVELNVTKKIEDALEGVDGIDKYESQSMENHSTVIIKIDEGTEDLKKVKDDVRSAIADISDFPEEVTDRPTIIEIKTDNMPVFEIGLSYAKDSMVLQKHSVDLRKELMQLSHVAKVDKIGVPEKEIRVLINKKKLKDQFISFEEVIQAIKYNKIRLSAGSLESFTSEKGIVTFSEFTTPEEIGNIIVRSNEVGEHVKLRDVARIVSGLKKMDIITRINGINGMWLNVVKKGRSDIIDAVKQVKECISEFKSKNRFPEGFKITTLNDESIETEIRLSILYSNAIAGIVLVLLVLFFFFNRKIAFWTAAGIPIAMGLAFIGLSFIGITINRISILGLVVVLGMLVDDSIIVAENIFRYKEKGAGPEEAVVKGISKIAKPVFSTILTTIIVFIPMYIIPGVTMDFSREIPTFVIALLLSSLVESLIILPAHLGHEKTKTKKEKAPLGDPLFQKLEDVYGNILGKAVRHKYISLGILMGFLIVGFLTSSFFTKFTLFPTDQSYRIIIYGEVEKGSSINYTSAEIAKLEKIFSELPKGVVKSFYTEIGKNEFTGLILPNLYSLILTLTPSTERDIMAMDVKNFIINKIKSKNLISINKIDYYIDGGGPVSGKPIEIHITGNDNKKRLDIINSLKNKLGEYGIEDIDSNYRDGKNEIRLKPNYKNIAMAQLNVSNIATVIRTAFDGTEAAHMDSADDQVPFNVMLDKRSINYNKPLEDLYVKNRNGRLVPLKMLVNAVNTRSQETIYRYNGTRTNKLTGNINTEKTTPKEVYDKLKKVYSDFDKKNPGFKLILAGEAEKSSEVFNKMMIAISVSIIAIYFILIIQFNSFFLPAIVILAIPFGLVGILLAFIVQGMHLSMLALIGILGYSGVIINDSLILVDYISNSVKEKEVDEKSDFYDSMIEGSQLRLKPILITTITTVAGLIPTAYGFFGGLDSFISPMVMVLVWGLAIGTPSVLFVIPVVYSINEDIKLELSKAAGYLKNRISTISS